VAAKGQEKGKVFAGWLRTGAATAVALQVLETALHRVNASQIISGMCGAAT
jgi:hypothetical protein